MALETSRPVKRLSRIAAFSTCRCVSITGARVFKTQGLEAVIGKDLAIGLLDLSAPPPSPPSGAVTAPTTAFDTVDTRITMSWPETTT